jgi:chromate transporter
MTTVEGGRAGNLAELATVFLRLGLTAFGGPAAHVGLFEAELVRRRQWLTHEQFLDLLGAANLIPGPTSTEFVIHVGYRRAGWAGLVVAGTCFILPSALIVTLLAWIYVHHNRLPAVSGLLQGVAPVIIAIMLQALVRLAKTVARTLLLVAVVLVSAALLFLGVDGMAVLLGAGLVVFAARGFLRLAATRRGPGAILLATVPAVAQTAVPFTLGGLFLVFLKVGAVMYGSGYVLLAFLQADLVERYGWLTDRQLLEAIAVGQGTPGPLLTTATFIGYVLAEQHGHSGVFGAVLATVAIFLPAFVYVALSGPLVPRLRRSPAAAAFLDGVNAAVLAWMAVVTWRLGQATFLLDGSRLDVWALVLAGISAILMLRWRVPSTWLVVAGAVIGLLLSLLATPFESEPASMEKVQGTPHGVPPDCSRQQRRTRETGQDTQTDPSLERIAHHPFPARSLFFGQLCQNVLDGTTPKLLGFLRNFQATGAGAPEEGLQPGPASRVLNDLDALFLGLGEFEGRRNFWISEGERPTHLQGDLLQPPALFGSQDPVHGRCLSLRHLL